MRMTTGISVQWARVQPRWKTVGAAMVCSMMWAAQAQAPTEKVTAMPASVAAQAAPSSAAVLARSSEGAAVSTNDVRADALRIPPQVRGELLSKTQNVGQMIDALLVRRVMAQRAQASVPSDAQLQAALQIAQDKVWSDAWMAQLDAQSEPTAAVAEGLARELYRVNPQRFTLEEQVQARHILVMGTDDVAKAKAQDVLKQLQAGGDFAELAKFHSQDPGSSQKGGDLGFFTKGKMVPEFERTAFALEDGAVSDLVQSQFGWHIIQRTASKPAGLQPYADVRDALIQEVSAKVRGDARQAAVAEIRSKLVLEPEAVDALVQEFVQERAQAR